jgi:uncharacterized membrane protein
MNYRTVEAGRGVGWLTDAVALVLRNPAVFLVMALIVAVIGAVPVLGQLTLLVIGPALWGGFAWGLREQDAGREATVGHLFAAFTQPGKIGPMLLLCLPSIAAILVFVVLGFLLVGGALLTMGVTTTSPGSGMANAFSGGALLGVLLMLLVGLAVYGLIIFAIPRVMLEDAEPIAAMKDSLAASLANIVPLLIYGLVTGVIFGVLLVLLFWIPILGWLAWGLAFHAVNAAALYVAWKDVYGAAPDESAAWVPPPPPPPTA